jgi:hypothetical protein
MRQPEPAFVGTARVHVANKGRPGALDRTCGEAVIIDLTPVDPDHDITR